MTRQTIAGLTALALALSACDSAPEAEEAPARASVSVSAPVQTDDAYALAGTVEVAAREKADYPDLHNVFKLSDNIYSGSEPHGESALQRLADLGVKTILSVDGKVPDGATATKLGMRYVHVPIKYSGIVKSDLRKIAKTFRELEGPFYVHCFHGKHRGPAGAMVGRLVLDGVARETALADMKQCGTAGTYAGLYATIATAEIPSAEETAAWDWDFPAAHQLKGFRHAMIAAPRAFDNLTLLAKNGFAVDPAHPDLDPVNEAAILRDLFAQSEALEECSSAKEDFRRWLAGSTKASTELHDALQAMPANGDDGDAALARAKAALAEVKALCASCHGVYRNE